MEVDFSKEIQELKRNSSEDSLNSEELSEIISSILVKKVEKHNENHENKVTEEQLKKIYFRGSNSYETTHRVGKTKAQWAMARVNLFLKMNRGEDINDSYLISDKDILISEDEACASKDLYPFIDFSDIELNLACLDLVKAGVEKWDQNLDCENILYSEAEKKTLNRPFVFGAGEFGVFVKDPIKQKTILVRFDDSNLDHSEGGSDVTAPEFWSSKFWKKKPIDESISFDAVEWDEEEIVTMWVFDSSSFVSRDYIFEQNPSLKDVDCLVEKEGI